WSNSISIPFPICSGLMSYTASSTQTASMSTRWEIHAPVCTKASAAASCFASSRASRRTRTLVSTARMASPHVLPDAFLEILEASGLGLRREHGPVKILEGMPTDAPDGDSIPFGIPFQDGSRYKLEPLAHLGGNRDLSLRRDPGLRELHGGTLPR